METSTLVKRLRTIGLSEKAAAVYVAVLEAGTAFPSNIAKTTKINRSTVYAILTELAIKGLVTEIERNKKICYQIEKPDKLVGFASGQVRRAEERLEKAKKIAPELEGLFSLIPNKPKVRFFEGLDGVLAVYDEHVAEKEPYEMVAYSNVEQLIKRLPERFAQNYVKKKQKISITTRAIFPDTAFSAEYDHEVYSGIQKKFLVQSRTIPAKDFPYEGEVTMFGKNKISIINFYDHAQFGVIIEDATIAGMMRMVFELAWKGADSR